MGRTIAEALERAARGRERAGYRYSYDMLGEAARTAADAERYFAPTDGAIAAIGASVAGRDGWSRPASRSSSRRFIRATRRRSASACSASSRRGSARWRAARKAASIGFCVDAEEAERLDLSLDLIAQLALAPSSRRLERARSGRAGLSEARAGAARLARCAGAAAARRRFMVRLVKGAYWDSEIKRSQERGLAGYPVFTRKLATDVSYIACAKRILAVARRILRPVRHPQRAHAGGGAGAGGSGRQDFEFQRLHGMGEALYEQIVGSGQVPLPRLCAGREPRGPPGLSRAASPGERRQHLLRQSPGR